MNTALHYRLLPEKLLDLKRGSNKVGMKTNKERMTLLLYSSVTESHNNCVSVRVRILGVSSI
jgi:hypothetical protein